MIHLFATIVTASLAAGPGPLVPGDVWIGTRTDLYGYDIEAQIVAVMPPAPDILYNSVRLGPEGLIYVTSTFDSGSSHRVRRYHPLTGALHDTFSDVPQLRFPADVAFGPDGYVYVLNQNSSFSPRGSVTRHDADTGAYMGTLVDQFAGGLSAAQAMSFGPDGDLYVIDGNSSSVAVFDGTTGVRQADLAFAGASFGALRNLQFRGDTLYLLDRGAAAVRMINLEDFAYVGDLVAPGDGDLISPQGFDWDVSGDVFVVDSDGSLTKIKRFDGETGEYLGLVGIPLNASSPRALQFLPLTRPADVSGDGHVGYDDLLALLSSWGSCAGCDADLTGQFGLPDNTVDMTDLMRVLSNWG